MTPIKMLPCPFCEGPPCVIVQNDHPHYGLAERLNEYGEIGKEVRAFVFCHECGAKGETEEDCIYTGDEYDDLEERACLRWNRRDARHRSMYDASEANGLNLHPRRNNNYTPDSPHKSAIPTGEPGVIRRDVGLTDNTRDGGEE